MKLLFTQILNMSFTASVVILLVLAMRYLLRREPKIYAYALWAVVLFRLLCPISLTGDLSLLNFASSKSDNYTKVEPSETGIYRYETNQYSTMNYIPAETVSLEPEAQVEAEKSFDWKVLGAYIWLIGVAGMGLSGMVSFWKLKKQLSEAIHWKKEVYLTDQVQTPFVLGLWKPKSIYPLLWTTGSGCTSSLTSGTTSAGEIPFSNCWPTLPCACIGSIRWCGWHSIWQRRTWK